MKYKAVEPTRRIAIAILDIFVAKSLSHWSTPPGRETMRNLSKAAEVVCFLETPPACLEAHVKRKFTAIAHQRASEAKKRKLRLK